MEAASPKERPSSTAFLVSLISADPTITPSAMSATLLACSAVPIPNPTAMSTGLSAADLIFEINSSNWLGSDFLAPVIPVTDTR